MKTNKIAYLQCFLKFRSTLQGLSTNNLFLDINSKKTALNYCAYSLTYKILQSIFHVELILYTRSYCSLNNKEHFEFTN